MAIERSHPGLFPLVDVSIAATARVAGAVLVQEDPHMSQILSSLVARMPLTDESVTQP